MKIQPQQWCPNSLRKLESRSWATKVKVKGDIRLRYQYQDTDGDDRSNARSRGRYEARIGIIKPVDNFEAGVGLVSGLKSESY